MSLAPWRRAPGRLLREPGAFAAVSAATFILAVAACSAPLFLGSTGAAALERSIAAGCRESGQVVVDDPSIEFARSGFGSYGDNTADLERDEPLVYEALGQAGLPVTDSVLSTTVTENGRAAFTVFSRSSAIDHLEIVEGRPAERGAWLPESFATAAGLRTGDRLDLGTGTVPVAGVYTDLGGTGFEVVLPDYWCAWRDLLVPSLESAPPPFVIVDRETLFELGGTVAVTWYSELPPEQVTLAGAREVLRRVDVARAAMVERDLIPEPGAAPSFDSLPYDVRTDLPRHLARAEGVSLAVVGPVLPLAVITTGFALGLTAVAGGIWADRRRAELDLLAARGVGPLLLAGKAALEMAPAMLVSGVLGWSGTLVLVGRLGPSPRFEPGAVLRAASTAAFVVGLGLGLASWVGAARAAARLDPPGQRRLGTWFRPVVPLGLVAVGSVAWLGSLGAAAGNGSGGSSGALDAAASAGSTSAVDTSLTLSLLIGGVLVIVGLLGITLRLALRRSAGWGPAPFLAARRLGNSWTVVAWIAVLTALPVGTYLFSSGAVATTQASLAAKAATYSGADRAVRIAVAPAADPPVGDLGTVVSVLTDVEFAGRTVQVRGVEPRTFADFAIDVTDGRLHALVAEVAAGPGNAILVSPTGNEVAESSAGFRYEDLRVEVVETVDVFPGLRMPRADLLVVDRAMLAELDPLTPRHEEVWTTQEALAPLLGQLGDLGVRVESIRTPDALLDVTGLLTITWAFGYQRAVAVLAGLIAACGLLLYLGLRCRRLATAYVLLRRMGLRRRQHAAAVFTELAAVLVPAWCAGWAVGLSVLALTGAGLDVSPEFAPSPQPVLPWPEVATTGVIVLAVALAGALGSQWLADRAHPAQVLRSH